METPLDTKVKVAFNQLNLAMDDLLRSESKEVLTVRLARVRELDYAYTSAKREYDMVMEGMIQAFLENRGLRE